MQDKQLIIAIDGPAGAGKSTVAKLVAQQMKYLYIDTGAMYRAITYLVMKDKVPLEQQDKISLLAENARMEYKVINNVAHIIVNGDDVTDLIRTPQLTEIVSFVAKIAGVRDALLLQQRRLAATGGVVMDGRDIGTRVLPQADIKVFLTASIDERAKRRYFDFCKKGYTIDIAEIKQDIARRDKMDTERAIAPLIPATDAVIVDTSAMDIAEVVKKVIVLCKEK